MNDAARTMPQRRPRPPHGRDNIIAREEGPLNREAPPPNGEGDYGSGASTTGEEPLPKLVPMPYAMGKAAPVREWIVDGWVPRRKVTLLQGDGGDGKSPLLQQLQSSCATALPWLGLRVKQCDSLGVYTEDEPDDIEIRQAAIDAAYGLDCRNDFQFRMHLFPRAEADDNELVRFARDGSPILTPFYRQVREAAMDLHVGLVTLDVAVDLYGGHEIDRRQVRAFFRPLGALARAINGSVVLSSHVSQSAIRSDGGHSASTDWSNAVRSRAYLSRPPKENDQPEDPDARLLTRKKANFASVGDTIKLHVKNGILILDGLRTPSYFRRSADDVFMALLDDHYGANRRPLSESKNATNYAPNVFAAAPENARDGYRASDFRSAMERLFKARKIKSADYGRKGDLRKMIVRRSEEEQ